MKQDTAICAPCPYYRRGYVEGKGNPEARLMFIGEAPGVDEAFRSHHPFTGPAGKELDRWLHGIHISREEVWITNVVKCNPPENEDPQPEVMKRCSHYLEQELEMVNPEVIVTLGAIALRRLRPLSLDMVWGIPQSIEGDTWIFPLHHPALGLHNTRMLPMISEGFKRLGLWLNGNEVWSKDEGMTRYQTAKEFGVWSREWENYASIAVDTETTWDSKPLYIQLCGKEHFAQLEKCEDKEQMKWTKLILENPDLLIILHNAMFDLEVLHQVDIHPPHVVDTMVMAYLLGDLPLGLKPLAYRLAGMEMKSYRSVIGSRGDSKAKAYLETVEALQWPNPEHILEFKEDGSPHVKKPQNIGRKVARALRDHAMEPLDLHKRWYDMEGTEIVEKELGPMPDADLRDVEESIALIYACRDADATRRIYPILKHRIQGEGLQGVLDMDMGVIPMVLSMMHNGITVNLKTLGEVGDFYERRMEHHERELEKLLGYKVNPRSSDQMAAMLVQQDIPGKRKVGKSGKQSTGVKVLEPLRADYPVVCEALEWKKYATLKSVFVDTIPKYVGPDGKVHTTIKITRTITGRLATENPNLMAMPVRTPEGLLLRNVFEASEGYVLVSLDYSQIEMRVEACRAMDEAMLNIFRKGLDIHSETASRMFHLPIEALDSMKHRYPAKRIGFGILYGISPQGLVDQMEVGGAMGWTVESCEALITSWLASYPGIAAQMDEDRAQARRLGYMVDMWGRRRLIPEVYSSSKKIVEEGLRYAINQPVQSGAQGVIKTAMRKLWYEVLLKLPKDTVRMLLQTHDDLLAEIKEKEVEWLTGVIQGTMETAVKLVVPTPVDPKMGLVWGKMSKV